MRSALISPPSRIEMSADRIKMAEIGLFKVGDAGFGSEIIAQGSVAAPPSGLAVLTAGADGRVTRNSNQIGDPVARGDRSEERRVGREWLRTYRSRRAPKN